MQQHEAQFTDKRVHMLKVISESGARSWCGLQERWEIWQPADHTCDCRHCQRFASPGQDGGEREGG